MTTGGRGAGAALIALSVFAAGAQAAAAEWGVADLMRSLQAVKSSKARFVERKELSILTAPLESSGTLIYRAPGRLEKHTLAPERESLVLDDGRLVLENAERGWRKSFALHEHPVVWAFVESIRSTLAGDLATLRRFYDVGLEGSEPDWRLVLRPREAEMKAVVDEIRVSGGGTSISRIEIRETGGNRSVMTISREEP
jgi:outer membrane lipoprotein-sorting protein